MLPVVLFLALSQAAAPPPPSPPRPVTQVLALLAVKPGIERAKVMAVMPEEIRATVQLHLEGKIQQWYGRADGLGVVFVLNCTSVEDARNSLAALPLLRENLVQMDYIALSPLFPLRLLLP